MLQGVHRLLGLLPALQAFRKCLSWGGRPSQCLGVSPLGWHCPSVSVVYPMKNYSNPQSVTLNLGFKLALYRQKSGKNPSRFLASLRSFVKFSYPREELSERENAIKPGSGEDTKIHCRNKRRSILSRSFS